MALMKEENIPDRDTEIINLGGDEDKILKNQEIAKWLSRCALPDIKRDETYEAHANLKYWVDMAKYYRSVLINNDEFTSIVQTIDETLDSEGYKNMQKIFDNYKVGSMLRLEAEVENRLIEKKWVILGTQKIELSRNHYFTSKDPFTEIYTNILNATNNDINFRRPFWIEAQPYEDRMEFIARQKRPIWNLRDRSTLSYFGKIDFNFTESEKASLMEQLVYEYPGGIRFFKKSMDYLISRLANIFLLHSQAKSDGVIRPVISDRTIVRNYNLEHDITEEKQINPINDNIGFLEDVIAMHVYFQNGCYIVADQAEVRVVDEILWHRGTDSLVSDEDDDVQYMLENCNDKSIVVLDEPYRCVLSKSFEERNELAYECVNKFVSAGAVIYINTNPVLYERLMKEGLDDRS